MLLLFFTALTLVSVSCKENEKDEPGIPSDNTSPIVSGSNTSLITAFFKAGGNITPSFALYPDGTCQTFATGTSTRDDSGTWVYDQESKVLVLLMKSSGNHTYTVKALTESTLTAEWSSVQYGNFTSTWERYAMGLVGQIDKSLLPGDYDYMYGTKDINYLNIYEDGKCFFRDSNYDYNGTWSYDETKCTLSLKGSDTYKLPYHYKSPTFKIKTLSERILTTEDAVFERLIK